MGKKDVKLPKGIKAMSLVDLSHLNLSEAAKKRVAVKVSEAVLSEYASSKKALVAGTIGDLRVIGLPGWAGLIIDDLRINRLDRISKVVKEYILAKDLVVDRFQNISKLKAKKATK